jgi:hypothetical protein
MTVNHEVTKAIEGHEERSQEYFFVYFDHLRGLRG